VGQLEAPHEQGRLLDVPMGTERTTDVSGCTGRTAGGPCWRSHFVQRGTLTSQVVRGQLHGSPSTGREDSWRSLLEVPLVTERKADVPGCAGRTTRSPSMSREDCWRSLLEVPLVTERKADVSDCAGMTAGRPRTSREDSWISLLKVSLGTERKMTSQDVRS
jgi:hypothetical protein